MTKKVTLYTDNQEQSALARSYLKELNAVFEEINVTEDRNGSISINKGRMPFLVVKGSGLSTVSGFDEFRYASALDHSLSYNQWAKMKSQRQNQKQSKLA